VSDAISEEYTMTTATKARPRIKIHPLEDRVVILPAEEAETVRGRLHIPDTAREKPTQGEVLAVGPGRIEKGVRVEFDIEVGDTVLYGKYTGMPYQVGDDELLIIKATDVLAKIG
jgi:chaperonin GroES